MRFLLRLITRKVQSDGHHAAQSAAIAAAHADLQKVRQGLGMPCTCQEEDSGEIPVPARLVGSFLKYPERAK